MSLKRDKPSFVSVALFRHFLPLLHQISEFPLFPLSRLSAWLLPSFWHHSHLHAMENFLLIIDPETQELRKLREILTREGYNIMTATDKETAEQICERVHVQLILARASTIGFGNNSM